MTVSPSFAFRTPGSLPMKSKIHLLSLLCLLSAGGALAQEAPIPPELAAARTLFQSESEAALKPVRDRYLLQLQTLKKSATPQNAILIESEMKKVEPANTQTPQQILKHALEGSKWAWGGGSITFDPSFATNEGWKATWKITGAHQATLTLCPPNQRVGASAIFVFDEKVESFTGRDFSGRPIGVTKRK